MCDRHLEIPESQNIPPHRKKLLKVAGWVAVFTVGVAVGGLLHGIYKRPPDALLDYTVIAEKLTGLEQIIEDQFLFPVDPSSLENGIYRGLLEGLNDPYSVYFTWDELETLKSEMSGKYCGIGMEVTKDGNRNPEVKYVYDDSPAMRAGLRAGDVIEKVDGVSAAEITLEIITRKYIMGAPDTEASLLVYRPETDQTLLLTAVRAPIKVKTVEGQMLEDRTGYLRVRDFYDTTADEFIAQCGILEGQGMRQLIIDLRDNPGGSLDAVVQILDHILSDENVRFSRALGKSTIVYTKTQNGDTETYLAGDGHALKVPIKILVNRESASASEVLSGCLRDYGLAELVGETTFGKGIVQNVFELDGGDAVKLTTAQYHTPSGFGLHGVGLAPDIKLPVPMQSGAGNSIAPAEDPWVRQALSLFNREPVLKPLSSESNTAIAPPQTLLATLPESFSCKETHLKLDEQDLEELLATFIQLSGRQVKLRGDYWYGQKDEWGRPPFSYDQSYDFRSDRSEGTGYITFNFDLDRVGLHLVECDMLDPAQSVELITMVLDRIEDPIAENERMAILDAMEHGKQYSLNGKHSRLETVAYDDGDGVYLRITAN